MEQIYTIPINEAFEKGMEEGNCDCPMCKLYDKLEKKEVEMTLGPSMMEPATRIETNEKGFCHAHYRMLMAKNNSLSLALILESHLTEQKGKMDGNALFRISVTVPFVWFWNLTLFYLQQQHAPLSLVWPMLSARSFLKFPVY